MNNLAPILLFTYKRLETLKITVEALKANYLADQSDLYVFSDGAKKPSDQPIIAEIRDYIATISGFKQIHIIESDKNKGLATSIIDGVSHVLQQHDKVIVLEDDLSTTYNFLAFMNEGLNKYFTQSEVFSISGYSFNLGKPDSSNEEAYFLNRGWSWGWATWKHRWLMVDWEVKDYKLFTNDRIAKREFAKGGSDLNKMLSDQMTGKLDSWAIRWFYSQFRKKGLTLYPLTSKVFNNGFDEDATHTNGSASRYIPVLDAKANVSFLMPEKVQISRYYQDAFNVKMGFLARLKSKIETFIKIFFK
jgi:hypothetical protein